MGGGIVIKTYPRIIGFQVYMLDYHVTDDLGGHVQLRPESGFFPGNFDDRGHIMSARGCLLRANWVIDFNQYDKATDTLTLRTVIHDHSSPVDIDTVIDPASFAVGDGRKFEIDYTPHEYQFKRGDTLMATRIMTATNPISDEMLCEILVGLYE